MIEPGNCVNRERLFALACHLMEGREQRKVRAHVEACEACRRVVSEYQGLDSTLDEWKPVEPSRAFNARVRAAVAAQKAADPHFAFLGLRWAQVLAPACLLVLVIAGSLILSRNRRHTPTATPNQPITLPTAGVSSPAEQELTLYQNLPVLEDEDYDMLSDFDVLSEVPRGDQKLAD